MTSTTLRSLYFLSGYLQNLVKNIPSLHNPAISITFVTEIGLGYHVILLFHC
jgi:hypothetical protein